MIDAETLVVALIKLDMPDQAVEQERDIDTLSSMPVLIYSVHGPGQNSNGDGIWNVTYDFTALAASPTAAHDLATSHYDFATGWADERYVTEFGWVVEVTDSAYPSKDPSTDVEGKAFHQYSGSLNLTLRN